MPRNTVTMFPGDAKAQQAADAAAQKAADEARARCQSNPSEEDVALQALATGDVSLIINLLRKRTIDGPAREELIEKNKELIKRIEKLEAEASMYRTQISEADGQLLRIEARQQQRQAARAEPAPAADVARYNARIEELEAELDQKRQQAHLFQRAVQCHEQRSKQLEAALHDANVDVPAPLNPPVPPPVEQADSTLKAKAGNALRVVGGAAVSGATTVVSAVASGVVTGATAAVNYAVGANASEPVSNGAKGGKVGPPAKGGAPPSAGSQLEGSGRGDKTEKPFVMPKKSEEQKAAEKAAREEAQHKQAHAQGLLDAIKSRRQMLDGTKPEADDWGEGDTAPEPAAEGAAAAVAPAAKVDVAALRARFKTGEDLRVATDAWTNADNLDYTKRTGQIAALVRPGGNVVIGYLEMKGSWAYVTETEHGPRMTEKVKEEVKEVKEQYNEPIWVYTATASDVA